MMTMTNTSCGTKHTHTHTTKIPRQIRSPHSGTHRTEHGSGHTTPPPPWTHLEQNGRLEASIEQNRRLDVVHCHEGTTHTDARLHASGSKRVDVGVVHVQIQG